MSMLRRSKPLHGRSRWATNREIRKSGLVWAKAPPGDALVLGRKGLGPWRRYLCHPGDEHSALYAATGSGKGTGYSIPNCYAWAGSLVAYDLKGELWQKTAAAREAVGQSVFCFAPGATDGRSHRYNPYSVVEGNAAQRIDMIHRIGSVLVPPNPEVKEPFWINSARNAINGAAVILAETPNEPLHVGAIRRAFTRPDWRDWWRSLIGDARNAGRPYPQTGTDAVLSVVEMSDDKGREGICKEIQSHLGLWASPSIVAATETSDFDLREIRRRPMSIYVRLRPSEVRRFRPLTTLLFQQLLDLNTETEFKDLPEPRCRVLMLLDEFASLGAMPLLADSAAYVRSFGLRMAYVMQTKDQLVSLYGREGADNLFENCHSEIFFGTKGIRAAKEASEMAGFDTVTETSTSRPRFFGWLRPGKQSENEAARRRALLLPQEVQRLPKSQEIVYRPGMQPIRCKRVVYYRDPLFAGLEAEPPEVPLLNVHVARDAMPVKEPA